MEQLRAWGSAIEASLAVPIFTWGETVITLGNVLYLVVFILLLTWLSAMVRRLVVRILMRGGGSDVGTAQAIGSIVRYALVLVGLLIIIQTAGIDLTTLNVLAGAVGIGVGFGLQTIAANFISGLILLIERPIKVGDRIEIGDVGSGGVLGDVIEISVRATTVRTNDNVVIILPNSRFVEQPVVNWAHNDRQVRFGVPVQVAYGTDVRMVERILLEVAAADTNVLSDPAPAVRFLEFGDNGLKLELRAWSSSLIDRKGLLVSNLNFAIYDAFAAQGIEIPFPQRVVHVRKES